MIAAKRFWEQASAIDTGDGFSVELDGKPIRTPGNLAFVTPPRALAEAVAAEWDVQGDDLDPHALPQTRLVNTALEGVPPNRGKMVADIAAYGGSDLLCYRAAHPEALVARQAERGDPLLDWLCDRYSASLMLAEGVMPVAQPATSVTRLGQAVDAHDDFELAALHDLVGIAGSLVLGLAVSGGRLDAVDAFSLSRLDEDWQTEQWGEDADAAAVAARKAEDFAHAARFLSLVRQG